jgi:hypothetical protein
MEYSRVKLSPLSPYPLLYDTFVVDTCVGTSFPAILGVVTSVRKAMKQNQDMFIVQKDIGN